MNWFFVLLLVLGSTKLVPGAKILGVFQSAAPSHYILDSALMKGLAERGHDVTVISYYGEKNVPKGWKYRDIVIPLNVSELEAHRKHMFKREGSNPFIGIWGFNMKGLTWTERVLEDPGVLKLIHSNEKFDAVIMEQFVNHALKGLAPHFGASLILLNTMSANAWINNLMANPSPPAYIPDSLLPYTPKMNLWERLVNSVYSVYQEVLKQLIFYPRHNALMKKYLPNVPDLSIVNYNISLGLLNSHISLSQPVPHVPNMIEIGGYHIKPTEKLPDDLQKFLDDAKEGVIYFSMGSNLKSANMPTEKRTVLLNTFRKLKEKVLWKWEDDTLPNKPPNVEVRKWFPQQSVLAHPNVKLFITHGGLLSTLETIYCGVPLLAMPIFGDQDSNAQTAVMNGYGLKFPFRDLEEESFTKALTELLSNPKYRENAKIRSKLMHDRPIKPLDEAMYWIEYVIRHKGAMHFRSAALDLSWYQYMLLDVLAVILTVISLTSFILVAIVKLICCRKKKDVQKKKVKKN